jgi:hypothetical protein
VTDERPPDQAVPNDREPPIPAQAIRTRPELVTILTTEHYNLQTLRVGTISESSGRLSAFLSALSGAVVALALVAQVSQFGEAFRIAALIILPTVLFIGVASFVRQVQLSMADIFYTAATNRIRHYYLDVAPEADRYLTLSPYDDMFGVLDSMGGHDPKPNPFQLFVTAAGMIEVINSVLAGVVAALVVVQAESAGAMGPAIPAGIGVALVVLALHIRYQGIRWDDEQRRNPARFPSPDSPGGPVPAFPWTPIRRD